MTNLSSGSIGASQSRQRIMKIIGIPSQCWCGAGIVTMLSKTEANPYRRFFRCEFAAKAQKYLLDNDPHTFKWVDEALLDDLTNVQRLLAIVEGDVRELTTKRKEQQTHVFEEFQKELEKNVMERVEAELSKAKSSVKKMMIAFVLGGVIVYGYNKLFG